MQRALWRRQSVASLTRHRLDGGAAPGGATAAVTGTRGHSHAAVSSVCRTSPVGASGSESLAADLCGAAARPNLGRGSDDDSHPHRQSVFSGGARSVFPPDRRLGDESQPEKHMAITALQMALTQRRPAPGLIHHTDRGAQYLSTAYRQLVEAAGLQASMSRKGNCYDNAVAESFFSTLKNELVHERDYQTLADVQTEVFEYIEVFYNRQRLHQTLGYVSPVQFEATTVPFLGCPSKRG